MEGNLGLKIDWTSLTVEGKFTVFALFYFVFEGNIPSTSPRGPYIWRGDLTEGFLHYKFGGLIFGGAYTWRGLFSEFYDMLRFSASLQITSLFSDDLLAVWASDVVLFLFCFVRCCCCLSHILIDSTSFFSIWHHYVLTQLYKR